MDILNFHNIKIIFITTLLLPLMVRSIPSVQNDEINSQEHVRVKRAGSFDFIGSVKRGIVSGIGSASASVAAGSSSSSSSGSSAGKSYPTAHVHVHQENKFDGWQLKKSILNTLFQAVKAITGGVTALKGQLIKGSGYIVSAKGKLISASGDVVTNVGKNIASSAQLIKPSHSHHFAKLSGASSSAHNPEPTAHEQSFTSYDAPTAHTAYESPTPIVHASPSYGPPVLPSSIHTSYGSPTASHSGYPNHNSIKTSFSLPSTHSATSFHTPSQIYGAAVEEPYSNSYYNPSHEEHGQINYDFTSTGNAETIHTGLTVQKPTAADVLRNILQKLPTPTNEHDVNAEYDNIVLTHDHKKIEQYEIPPDPVPAFKPLKQYDLTEFLSNPAHDPRQSISQTHTIATEYGAPITDYQNINTYTNVHSSSSNNNNNFNSNKINLWNKAPIKQYPLPQSPNSFNVYQQMSLKREIQTKHRTTTYFPPLTQKTPFIYHHPLLALPPQPSLHKINNMDKHVHQQQLKHIKNTIGGDFIIQKSLGYELKSSNSNQIKRRIDETLMH